MIDIPAIQQALQDFQIDVWLLFDFRGSNILARRVLGLDQKPVASRRFCYAIPRVGEPLKLVHRIELGSLDHLPGPKQVYLRWEEFEAGIKSQLKLGGNSPVVALEYSPRNAVPTISRVDAGLIELVRELGGKPISSGNLIQLFEATWSDAQWDQHLRATKITDSAYDKIWRLIRDAVTQNKTITEQNVADAILEHFAAHHLLTSHPPSVAVNEHASDPHYSTGNTPIRAGDLILVDLWGKLDEPKSVYSDLTRMGYVGHEVPAKIASVFQVVVQSRDAAIRLVQERIGANQPLFGWEVDRAGREVVERAGFGDYFVHRIGHSIGQETHGNGANMDSLETREDRLVLPATCFSIEPGIYLPEFGVRTEINVFVDKNREVHVTGGIRGEPNAPLQNEVLPIMSLESRW